MSGGGQPLAYIVADDLTGAADTAAQMAPSGARVEIGLYGPLNTDRATLIAKNVHILSIDTASRGMAADEAKERITGLLRHLPVTEETVCYKKIDSGLRGNVAGEIAALLEVHPDATVVMAPAFPAVGRATLGGVQHADGRAVTMHPTGEDLLTPVVEAHIPTLLKTAVNAPIASIPLSEVRRGSEFLLGRLQSLKGSGYRVIVVDAESDQDLDVVARSLVESGLDRFVAGSGGLAGALRRVGRFDAGFGVGIEAGALGVAFRLSGPGVVASASRHPVARGQLRACLAGDFARTPAMIQLEPLWRGGGWMQREEERLEKLIATALAQGRDVVLGVEQDSTEQGDPALSRRINGLLGRLLTRGLSHGASWMFLVGGDTARSFCDAAGVCNLRLATDAPVPEGLSIVQVAAGDFAGVPIVMKSGGFGGEALISSLMQSWRKD